MNLTNWLREWSVGNFRIAGRNLDSQWWYQADGPEHHIIQSEISMQGLRVWSRPGGFETQRALSLDRLQADNVVEWTADGAKSFVIRNLDAQMLKHSWQSKLVAATLDSTGRVVEAQADVVNVAIAKQLLRMAVIPRGTFRKHFDAILPQGQLLDLAMSDWRFDQPLNGIGGLRFSGMAAEPAGNYPGINTAQGRLALNEGLMRFTLFAEDTVLAVPQVMRAPVAVKSVEMDALLDREDANWRLQITNLLMDLGGAQIEAQANLVANGGKPFVDGYAEVVADDITVANRLWPRTFSPELLDWLDDALHGGRIQSGRALMYGDLDDWPFESGEGRFEGVAQVEDVSLHYSDDWPIATEIDAKTIITSQGMSATFSYASLGGVPLSLVEGDLPKFSAPSVSLNLGAQATAESIVGFINQSPLRESIGPYLSGLEISDDVEVWTNLEFDLDPNVVAEKVVGHIWFDDNEVYDKKWDIEFADTSGRLNFTATGVQATNLTTTFENSSANLSISSGEFLAQEDVLTRAQLNGSSSTAVLRSRFPEASAALAAVPDKAPWTVTLDVPKRQSPATQGMVSEQSARVTLEVDLTDTPILLPAPFGKLSGQPARLIARKSAGDAQAPVELHYGDLFRVALRGGADGEPLRGALACGTAPLPAIPNEGFNVAGYLPKLDADGWLALMTLLSAADSNGIADQQQWLDHLDLRLGSFQIAQREFEDVQLEIWKQDNYWFIETDADGLRGRVRVHANRPDRQLVLAEFDALVWDAVEGRAPGPDFDPAQLPPIQFFAEDLQFQGIPLGAVRFETYPTENGMHIEQLSADSDALHIGANGDWWRNENGEFSEFQADITGEDLGQILGVFGFEGLINGGQSVIEIDAEWDGAPSDFRLSRLEGSLTATVGRGEIVEVEPGAGRLFGLLSLRKVPRRLRLDFADLFKSGLVFDSIDAAFRLERGNAYTDGVRIKGPTAEIRISGRTGLVTQDYDQQVTVIPQMGDALPIVGAIAGGGAGAAAALLLQNIFSNQIERITQYHYAITGPWDEPQVELIGADDEDPTEVAESLPEPQRKNG